MKRTICLLSSGFLAILILTPSITKAADVSVGASAWFATWEFNQKATTSNPSEKTSMGPELMLGPSLSVRFAQDWTLASVFLYSATKYQMSQGNGGADKVSRMDSDTTINYSINRYFKIFPGLKYMRFSFSGGYHESVGPGFGMGVTLPAYLDNLFLIMNGSGAYLFGNEKNQGSNSLGFKEYGFNLSAGLAYYIAAISTTVNLGYRYQVFYTRYNSANNSNADIDHTFRGLNMSVIYSF